jgi:hypothetical protein
MKFNENQHFIYITMRVDEHKEQLQSYYKLTKEDLEEITKDWSVDLLIPTDPVEMSNPKIDILETTHKEHDTPGTNRRKNTEEVQDLSSALGKNAYISPERGGDDDVAEMKDKKDEQKKGELTPSRDKADPLKKRKVSPLKISFRKKLRATMTKMQTTLTPDDFDFIIVALNYASLEIVEKQEDKKEEMYDRIEVEL